MSNIGIVIDNEAKRLMNFNSFETPVPSSKVIEELMSKIYDVIFYEYSPKCDFAEEWLRRVLYDIYLILANEISNIKNVTESGSKEWVKDVSLKFIKSLHGIRRMLYTDVDALIHNDPAASSAHEVVASYPAIKALLHYRVAHMLLKFDVPILPRIITELAHSATGIDIHPGAVIGEYFGIDHGTGVVIGETSIIGNHVTIYQGVTLGAKNFVYDEAGNPLNMPRHPIIENNVTIYSNTSILGRITVGHDTVIGGNVWLTESVPAGSRVTQSKASEVAEVYE